MSESQQDYTGFVPSSFEDDKLKETELTLGLPGSKSPERKTGGFISVFGKESSSFKTLVSNGKRGYFDDVNCCENWGLSVHNSSEADLDKNNTFLSPKGRKNSSNLCTSFTGNVKKVVEEQKNETSSPVSKERVIGWPPIRSFRKNTTNTHKNNDKSTANSSSFNHYLKVSMDGAPYLRKIDLNAFSSYTELSNALDKMFTCFTLGQSIRLYGIDSEYVLTYEDKDGDLMLVGDVPWEMFVDSCIKLRIMKGSDAIGLAPRSSKLGILQ